MDHADALFRVTVNARPDSFPVAPGESVLDAGRRAGFTFPQACRNGNCFRCEGILTNGDVVHQRSHERLQGGNAAVLPCIVTPHSDCALTVAGVYGPGELPVLTLAAQVLAVTPLNHQVMQVQLRLPAGKRLARLAGQYLEIIDGDDAYAFSLASAPASGRDLELHLRHGADNSSSLQVLALLQREPVVTVRLPQGDCTLTTEPRLPLIIVAGSTGFAQAKAFIEHAIAQRWSVPITLYWGARTAADFYRRELLAEWQQTYPQFHAVLAVSQEPGAGELRSGYVHAAVLADQHELAQRLVYACGSPPMVYATQDALVAAGLPPERIFSDVFAWAPRP